MWDFLCCCALGKSTSMHFPLLTSKLMVKMHWTSSRVAQKIKTRISMRITHNSFPFTKCVVVLKFHQNRTIGRRCSKCLGIFTFNLMYFLCKACANFKRQITMRFASLSCSQPESQRRIAESPKLFQWGFSCLRVLVFIYD